MSVEPNTPDDWRTVTVNGVKADIGPDATVENVTNVFRTAVGQKRTKIPSSRRHQFTPNRYAVVREATVGRDDKGLLKPEDMRDIVPWDCSTVEDGDSLYLWSIPDHWNEVYPEYSE